jgi:Tol biopolymer transport system component
VRDTHGDVTTLVSVGAVSPRISGSAAPVITPDGHWVAFFSAATNLVAGTPAYTNLSQNIGEVYVRDMIEGTTVWASSYASNAVSAIGVTNAISYNQVISDDGQFVAYEANQRSSATAPQAVILRYHVADGVTDVIHTNASGTATGYEAVTRNLDMTPDGRFVAYIANATGNSGTNTCVNVWDAQNGTNILASTDPSASLPLTAVCDLPMLDSSGRFVAFTCTAALTTNAVIGNALSGPCHLYVRDLQANVPQLVDADPDGVGAMLAGATAPSLSADGRLVAFESRDTSLVANDRNHAYDVFLRDLRTSMVELVSVQHPSLPCWSANDASAGSISVSADGSRVAFASDADNLVANDTNGWRDVFVHDLSTGTNLLVSADASNQTSGNGFSSEPVISADGDWVAFSSRASNLVSGDANNAQDVFIRDVAAQRTELVSINKTGTSPGNAPSYTPAVSATGRYVLFRSKATDLATGFYSGQNLFLRDRQLGTNYALTTLGLTTSATTPDLRYIAFVATSGNLYVWDSQAGHAIYTNLIGTISAIGISPDGRRVVYASSSSQLNVLDRIAKTNGVVNTAAASPYFPSHIGLQFSTNGQFVAYSMNVGTASSPTNAVYVSDLLRGTNLLVSRSFRPAQLAGGSSDSPAISPDGRFVAYRSVATNIVPAASNGVANLLLYDSLKGTNTLLTASRYGSVATGAPALSPMFSADGATIVFCSWAWDLAPNDFNAGADAFAYDLSGLINAFAIQIIPPAASGGSWTITWPVSSGRSYKVEYKDDLNDPAWHDLGSPITILGTWASATDPVLTTARFYRVLAF